MQNSFIQMGSKCKHLRITTDRNLKSSETTERSKVLLHCLDTSVPTPPMHTLSLSFNHTITSLASSFPFWALGSSGSKPWLCRELMKAETHFPVPLLWRRRLPLGFLLLHHSNPQQWGHKHIHSSHSSPQIVWNEPAKGMMQVKSQWSSWEGERRELD